MLEKNVEIRQIILENTSKSDKKLLIMVSVVSLVSVSNAIKTQRHGGTENNNKFSEDTEILSFLKIQREKLCGSVPLCLIK